MVFAGYNNYFIGKNLIHQPVLLSDTAGPMYTQGCQSLFLRCIKLTQWVKMTRLHYSKRKDFIPLYSYSFA